MAQSNCANCRFYHPYGNGKGYCSRQGSDVKHGNSCSEYEED